MIYFWHTLWNRIDVILKGLVSMENYGLNLGCCSTVIDSKGIAIAFAVMMSLEYPGGGRSPRVNYRKAQKLFDFICSNVNLPDVKKNELDFADSILKGISQLGGKKEVAVGS